VERLAEVLVKLLLVLLLAPIAFCLVGQAVAAILGSLLPWLIGLGVLAATVAGATAGLALRRRLPSRPPGSSDDPLGAHRVRRPRGTSRGHGR
jgi:hypothetical protein